jgi:NADH-quinone oxidoreductase subunit G
MPRPNPELITFTIDGREVQAPVNTMLVDAAKLGDVEIPVFCYEPKLGAPVGACRMCLVEVEGIPKLQTGCSTPVKDGMVVHTQTDRVREAQEAVVEFLLVNHPLDCPVCDKGGECPLQDISFGWGGGRSRFIEPKRHFQKPLGLSPLIAIDRERCILCYRCVRFSQEVSEDYQLVLQERGADTYVATFDGHPYVAPFSGNIIELCPVGALTSQPYRFRARPWDIEGSGSVCALCPGQCNVELTVRDERVLRVLSRDHDEVDDGWLCDRGRFAYQSIHVDERITQPLLRDGGELAPVTWERALEAAAGALGRMHGRVGALAGDGTTNEEGFLLQRLMREGIDSPHLDSRASGRLPSGLQAALGSPSVQATIPDLEFAHAVLVLDCEPVDDMPIVDLRIRKGVRRNGVKLAVASSRPSSLDPNAGAVARFAPGAGEAFVAALSAALGGGGVLDELAQAAGSTAHEVGAVADLLRDAGEDVVIVWGERLTHGARGAHAARALLNVAGRIVPGDHLGAGLLEVPSTSNGRGMREVGFLPTAGPGLAATAEGHDTAGIAAAAAAGELTALYLLHVDPLRSLPDRALWEEALDKATTVIAHASFLTEGIRDHATVVFPAEAYAEKEGTITHPDGRLQRLRSAIAHPGAVRPEWQVIADLAARVGVDARTLTGGMAFTQLASEVPFYAGITLDQIGGRGVRWPERNAALWPQGDSGPFGLEMPPYAPTPNGSLRLGTYRSIWASPEVDVAPALKFLAARQIVELNPADAARLGVDHGDRVAAGADGRRVIGKVHLRSDAPAGTAFLQTGTREDSAAGLPGGGLVEITRA